VGKDPGSTPGSPKFQKKKSRFPTLFSENFPKIRPSALN